MRKIIPIEYEKLTRQERAKLRCLYVENQEKKCWYCNNNLSEQPPTNIINKNINWKLFPKSFLNYPVHLHHSHKSGLTIGAVHAFCNAVLWQYHKE